MWNLSRLLVRFFFCVVWLLHDKERMLKNQLRIELKVLAILFIANVVSDVERNRITGEISKDFNHI